MFVIYAQRAEGLRWVKFVTPRRNIAEMKLLEIDKVVQSHATPEEPAWVWMEEIPDGADPETWIDVKFFRNKTLEGDSNAS